VPPARPGFRDAGERGGINLRDGRARDRREGIGQDRDIADRLFGIVGRAGPAHRSGAAAYGECAILADLDHVGMSGTAQEQGSRAQRYAGQQ
jgi:hypothetical protein